MQNKKRLAAQAGEIRRIQLSESLPAVYGRYVGGVAEWLNAPVLKTNDGRVAEWSIALVLKTSEPRGSVGSNPTSSANRFNRLASLSSTPRTLLQVRYKLAVWGV